MTYSLTDASIGQSANASGDQRPVTRRDRGRSSTVASLRGVATVEQTATEATLVERDTTPEARTDAMATYSLDAGTLERSKPAAAGQRLAMAVKRTLDITVSGLGLLVFSPVILVVAVLVAWQHGRPVLFRQERPGRGARPITIVKFRSMRHATDSAGNPLPDELRLTSFGAFLRRFSLDEIPQLWSVLKGDLSLIGPRPLLMEYLPLYTPTQQRRHLVRPGITGWAQVNGRNAIDWDRKFELDVWYVDNWSLWLDIRILFKTIWKVLAGEGISAQGTATMPLFQGSPAVRSQSSGVSGPVSESVNTITEMHRLGSGN